MLFKRNSPTLHPCKLKCALTKDMVIGFMFEVMGYAGRVMLRFELANRTYFVIYLLGTIMGPTFLSAAIYLILPHILALYGIVGGSIASQPLWITMLFLALDIFTLAFQGVGCAFAVDGTSGPEVRRHTKPPNQVYGVVSNHRRRLSLNGDFWPMDGI